MGEGENIEDATLNVKVNFEDEELNQDDVATRFYGVQHVVMSAIAMRKLLIKVYETFKGNTEKIQVSRILIAGAKPSDIYSKDTSIFIIKEDRTQVKKDFLLWEEDKKPRHSESKDSYAGY